MVHPLYKGIKQKPHSQFPAFADSFLLFSKANYIFMHPECTIFSDLGVMISDSNKVAVSANECHLISIFMSDIKTIKKGLINVCL